MDELLLQRMEHYSAVQGCSSPVLQWSNWKYHNLYSRIFKNWGPSSDKSLWNWWGGEAIVWRGMVTVVWAGPWSTALLCSSWSWLLKWREDLGTREGEQIPTFWEAVERRGLMVIDTEWWDLHPSLLFLSAVWNVLFWKSGQLKRRHLKMLILLVSQWNGLAGCLLVKI